MPKSNKAKSALPYARRLIEDEYVQEQLRNAAGDLRAAYERARKERARATEDKRLYGHLREAATSIRKAGVALQRPKPKRRLRKVTMLALAVGGTAMLTLKLQKQQLRQQASRDPDPPPRASVAGDRTTPPSAEPEHTATGTPHSAA